MSSLPVLLNLVNVFAICHRAQNEYRRFHTSPSIMLHARTKTKQHLLGIQQHTVLTGIILFPRHFLGVSNLMLPKTNQYESIATFIA